MEFCEALSLFYEKKQQQLNQNNFNEYFLITIDVLKSDVAGDLRFDQRTTSKEVSHKFIFKIQLERRTNH